MKQKTGMQDAATMSRMFFKGSSETNSATSTGKAKFIGAKPKTGPDIKYKAPRMGFGGMVKKSGPF